MTNYKLDDIKITRAIVESYTKKLLDNLEVDAAIVGGGPAGLTAAYYLAKGGAKTALFERKLSLGGGMWGGGIMFNKIVVQEESKKIFDEMGISTEKYEDNYHVADSIESVSGLCLNAVKKRANIFNLLSAEDVMIRENKVEGLVLNWTSVEMAGLHVDPVTIRSRFVIDATGHDANIASIIQKKTGVKLNTETGKIIGEGSMWADKGERLIFENTKEICPNVYAVGMASNAVFGGPRMGPVFGGMILSGKKAAELILERLKEPKT
ncbi:sulfide-dependent adenosine diphosphate thiazole synthase [Candidatus Woesearchaeota archaeon]|nr:sulfide-dependent adenosine diphosphate thiazole synthase [Candidatus Woesearchaeota archaeon]